ncbi:hypothetical protein ACVDFE_30435 [Lentzea chajnantorensis]
MTDRVLAVFDDLDACVITRSVRLLNHGAVIVVHLREPANRPLFRLSDTTTVHIGPFDERTWGNSGNRL